MFSGSSSNKNESVPKSKPGPKVGSKRCPHAARPGSKRMINQPNLNQQRLDQMSLFRTGSGREQDQSISTFSYGNVGSIMHSPVADEHLFLHKSGISKDLSNTMRLLFQHGVGPHRLSKILRIMHTQQFDELQFVYYNGINNYRPNVASQLFKGQGPQKFEPFSEFFDQSKYNGYLPSSNYFSYAYSSLISE
ncbi:hypothetical protein INT47_003715 [Mucor saturninus]|uniref:Uncharacterized protein n=1 Tax=Mucor saturninus TaxID=64648 RepID=A0A8H7RBP0_9FUNG|nr:hypothetical protein INT47_003715 [Mucor saturninus]